jgi:CubicO group peptidase (beta-lactamase class C family)
MVFMLAFMLISALVLTACSPRARVGALQTEFQSVELGDAEAVRVEIEFGAGDLTVTGGAEKLLEADFSYNVARLKPEVAYTDGTLVVRQPEARGLPVLRDIDGFRNEWDLRLTDEAPMDLSVNVGAGTSDLQLKGLSLTRLDVTVGAGESTIDLSGDWERDLDISIDSGAGDIRVRLPQDVGARVEINAGVGSVEAPGLTKDGDVYTNAAYGAAEVTLQVTIEAGVGQISLEVEEAAAATPDYSAITGALAQQIQAAVDGTGITGLSVALVDDQNIVWSEGFGFADKENGVEADPETVYMVASVSKLFTAAAIMQLADQGKIDIDQPLQTHIPEFSMKSRFAEADPITPRNLMTHHSGVPSNLTNGMVAYGDDQDGLTRSEFHNLVDDLKQAQVINSPNTVFSYSNLGYSLLGLAVERAAGQDFIAYMDEAILGPLGMNASSFTIKPNMKPHLSKEYLSGETQDRIWTRDISAATLHSSVEDLSRFMMMVFGEGELGGERILRSETLAEMLSPQTSDVPLDLGGQWGLGWWMVPLPGLEHAGVNAWHAGGDGMWNSLMVILPDHKLGVVVLNNSQEDAGGANFQIAIASLQQALKVKAGIEPPAAEPPSVVMLTADEMLSYQGLYTTDVGWVTIRSDGTDLYADALGQSFKLLPHGEGRFSFEGVSPSDVQMVIKTVAGRTAMYLIGLVTDVSYGERIEPTSISQAWKDRLGSYEVANGKPGFLTFLADVELKLENDFLLISLIRTDTGEQIEFPVGPLSDDEAVILGLGQKNRGDSISVVEVDGEEQLFYSGYLMRKVEQAAVQPTAEGAVYEDPQGRFSLPLVGDWEQIDTDGSYALFKATGFDLKMSVHSIESDVLEMGQEAALNQAGIDSATLTKADEAKMGQWYITFYSQGGGRGVTPLCQVADQVTYCLIFTGEEDLTNNPPEHVFKTFEGFSIAGKETILPTTIEDFETYVNSFVGDYPPGLTILITRGGEALYSKAFGMADGPKEMIAEPDTVYMWGSMTKVVTASAVMQLVDQGLVELDAPVADYLDYFPAEYGITVRQLLGHSSGLDAPVEFDIANLNLDGQPLTDPDRAAREFLEGLSKLKFEPGSSAFYSNPGFVMLGQIVAEVSGQPFVEYVREHILRPLGMVNTDFAYSSQAMIDKAAGHAFRAADVENFIPMIDQVKGPVSGAELIREVDDGFTWMTRYNVMAANGGLIGPATEAVRLAQMHLNGGELDGVRILSPEAVALMQEMQLTTSGGPLGYGLAWRVFDEAEHPFVEHDGGGTGLWAKMRLYPQEGLVILLMSNASGWDRDTVADAAANVVFSLLGQ